MQWRENEIYDYHGEYDKMEKHHTFRRMRERTVQIFWRCNKREDHLFGIVVSTSDCHPRGPGFDSRLYPRNFSESVGSGRGSTQPREDNWVAI